MKVPKLLKNKYILYILLIISIVNVLGYIALEKYSSLALFVVIGLLTTYFSKNMSIILLSAIVVTSAVTANNQLREGFEEGATNNINNKVKSTVNKINSTVNNVLKTTATKSNTQSPASSNTSKKTNTNACTKDSDCPKGKCENKKCVVKSPFQNNVPPSSPAPINDESDESIGDRIDYAATMEQAYDNLQKMLGKDGMKSITAETQKLVSQQKDLMGTLNSMAPILTSAKETLAGLDLKNMGGMAEMLQNLQAGPVPKFKK